MLSTSEPGHEPMLSDKERKRLRNLSKYYSTIQLSSPHSDQFLHPTAPRLSHDPTLTALCQLGAHKLDCQRSLVSIMDHKHQYILAEATRSISLVDNSRVGDGDELWVGSQALSLDFGICPATMGMFTGANLAVPLNTSYAFADSDAYIIYDLAKDERFQGRCYVERWPRVRFYAEVPLCASSGNVLGSYCVLDDKPRVQFTKGQISDMQEIARALVNHLELVRNKQDQSRSERLMQGLRSFVQGQSSIRAWWMEKNSRPNTLGQGGVSLGAEDQADLEFGFAHTPDNAVRKEKYRPYTSASSSTEEPPAVTETSASSQVSEPTTWSTNVDGTSMSSTTFPTPVSERHDPIEPVSHPDVDTQKESQSTEARPNHSPCWHGEDETVRGNLRQQISMATSIQNCFSRASNLVREGMDLEGVVFLDASVGGFLTQAEKEKQKIDLDSRPSDTKDTAIRRMDDESLTSSSEDSRSETELPNTLRSRQIKTGFARERERTKPCPKIGYSTKTKSSLAGNASSEHHFKISERQLQKLARRYPHGHVFHFDEAGLISSGGEDTGSDVKAASNSGSATGRRKSSDRQMDQLLFKSFPGARSLVFYPIWDSTKGRWFAACIAWTTDPARSMIANEVTYLAAFANSVMSEISCIEAAASDLAKSDFISSISHELRSPIHGVLGSAELLKETTTTSEQNDLIKMIEECGRTLIDTMSHLLDHAKINNLGKSDSSTHLLGSAPNPWASQISLTSTFNLSDLVEEVVQTVYAGHNFEQTSMDTMTPDRPGRVRFRGQREKISVICDIEQRANWTTTSEAGAWKRIVMNLLGNSLKYTEAGFISVSLRALDDSRSADTAMIQLSVKDTGRGIAQEYLKHRLYTPYAQEDNISAGAGLGLSIVRGIVDSMQGLIDVSSELGTGTEVKVSIPVVFCGQVEDQPLSHPVGESLPLSNTPLRELVVCFANFDVFPDINDSPTGLLSPHAHRMLALKTCLMRMVTEHFGMKTCSVKSIDNLDADFVILEDTYLQYLVSETPDALLNITAKSNVAFIALNHTTPSRSRAMIHDSNAIVTLSQPFGPRNIAAALAACLEYKNEATFRSLSGARLPTSTNLPDPWASFLPISDTTTIARPTANEASRNSSTSIETVIRSPSPPSTFDVPSRSDSPLTILDLVPPRPPRKILLVDDNDINLKILIASMRNLHCSYITASDGLQAVERYKEAIAQGESHQFEIVLMDISMPIMDGFAATREIRALESQCKSSWPANIIALTGLASAKAQKEAIESGMNMFMTKPVQLTKLRTLLGLGDEVEGSKSRKKSVAC